MLAHPGEGLETVPAGQAKGCAGRASVTRICVGRRRGSFAPGGASRGHVIPRGGMQGGFGGQNRGSRPNDTRFTRRY